MYVKRKRLVTCLFLILLIALTASVGVAKAGPANEINILSGGSSNLLKSPTAKMAIKYVAPADITLDKVMLLPGCGIPATNQPSWSVQIQTNSGSYPSGTALGKGTLTNPKDDVWSTVDISPNVALKKGQTYWIVVQYLSGPTPTSTKSWLGLYASKPTPDGTLTDIHLPYNYAGTNKGINDVTAKTNVAYFNGKIWCPEPNGRIIPTFVIQFTDGTYHGQPYRHNYAKVYGANKVGQLFTNYESKVVTQLSVPWSTYHATNSLVRPKDNLYYYICENNYNGKVLASGVFLTPSQVYVSGSGTGVFDRKWYTVKLSRSVTLEKGKKYFIYFSSPGTTTTSYWCTDAGNSLADSSALKSSGYGGTSSYVMRTT
ncbi:hypothetical protein, partial [Methanolobus chelungpuianus]